MEINLTAQHLFFYKDGKLLVESDFVSGNSSKGYDTPPGAYPITYKERNATLKGEDYRTPVDYWMPFNGNIGMHDAGWRSSFGGNIFKTSGSHGCVNLPPSVAKTIYENIEAGMPVLCYTLEGTGSKTTSSVPKETAAATTAAPTTAAPATKRRLRPQRLRKRQRLCRRHRRWRPQRPRRPRRRLRQPRRLRRDNQMAQATWAAAETVPAARRGQECRII
ncbi:MAG: L,D-transpeptidase [Hungatella hathewayi]